MRTPDKVALVGGALLAVGTDIGTRRIAPASQLVPAAAAGLVTAAVIYPAARVGREVGKGTAVRENVAVGATVAVLGAAVATRRSRSARRIVAAGWLAHAVFDNLHDRGATSRLPSWYPAVCAGYDVAVAGLLLAKT
jgi:hypothetical protein